MINSNKNNRNFPQSSGFRGDMEKRLEKDSQNFSWYFLKPVMHRKVKLVRQLLKLPPNGVRIKYKNDYAPELILLKDFPKKMNLENLNDIAKKLLIESCLSSRFYELVRAFIVFNKPMSLPLPPIHVFLEQSFLLKENTYSKPKLILKIYPDSTTRDIKSIWPEVVKSQKNLQKNTNKNIKFRLFSKDETFPIEEKALFCEVFNNTTLRDIHSLSFNQKITNKFTNLKIKRYKFIKFNAKKAIKLLLLDEKMGMEPGSDKLKARDLLHNRKMTNSLKQLRKRAKNM